MRSVNNRAPCLENDKLLTHDSPTNLRDHSMDQLIDTKGGQPIQFIVLSDSAQFYAVDW